MSNTPGYLARDVVAEIGHALAQYTEADGHEIVLTGTAGDRACVEVTTPEGEVIEFRVTVERVWPGTALA